MTEPSDATVEAVARAIAYDCRPPLKTCDIGIEVYWQIGLTETQRLSFEGNARAAIEAYERVKAEEREATFQRERPDIGWDGK